MIFILPNQNKQVIVIGEEHLPVIIYEEINSVRTLCSAPTFLSFLSLESRKDPSHPPRLICLNAHIDQCWAWKAKCYLISFNFHHLNTVLQHWRHVRFCPWHLDVLLGEGEIRHNPQISPNSLQSELEFHCSEHWIRLDSKHSKPVAAVVHALYANIAKALRKSFLGTFQRWIKSIQTVVLAMVVQLVVTFAFAAVSASLSSLPHTLGRWWRRTCLHRS